MKVRFLPVFLAFALAACGGPAATEDPLEPAELEHPPHSAQTGLPTVNLALLAPDGRRVMVAAELAVTPVQREIGLMGRSEMPEGAGMLFVFPGEQQLYFWMKDTLIPLDVLYFDADGAFLNAQTMTPCPPETADCPSYGSIAPARYALEVPPGFAEANGIGDGWRLKAFAVGPELKNGKKLE